MRNDSFPAWARASAIFGGFVWSIILFAPTSESHETELINRILLLGVLVIVPLGLALVATADRQGRHSAQYKFAVLAQPFAGLAVVASLFLAPGVLAAILASSWLVTTIGIGLFGLWRFLPRPFPAAEEVSVDAGLLYVSVGAVWLIMSRLGAQPFGFGDTIVLLTAVHFHFAGFAAPILAGLAGRRVARVGPARWLFRFAVAGIVGGTPLVAAGITFSPRLALLGAAIISAGILFLAVTILRHVLRSIQSRTARILLGASSIFGTAAMVLACVYAYSIVTRQLIINIPQMAMLHGLANSFGFALLGLIGWSLIKPSSLVAPPGVPFSRLYAGRFAGSNYFKNVGAISSTKAPVRGLVDDFSVYGRSDFDPRLVHKEIRSFYEETFRYRLVVKPHWRRGFRFAGRLVSQVGRRLGQMHLPAGSERLEDSIESRLLPLDDLLDGRTDVRGWVRTYEGTENAMYAAAYSTHSLASNAYMNIAFPVLGGNISSILHIARAATPEGTDGGVSLSTLPGARAGGDQGVYFANRLIPIRLPINEVITVWQAKADGSGPDVSWPVLKGKHKMWLCGIEFLELDYDIFPMPQAAPSNGTHA